MAGKSKAIEDIDPRLLEYPFARRGMGTEEFNEELDYMRKFNASDLKSGSYIPLWRQKERQEKI